MHPASAKPRGFVKLGSFHATGSGLWAAVLIVAFIAGGIVLCTRYTAGRTTTVSLDAKTTVELEVRADSIGTPRKK
jgi:hypothetical protein